MSLNPVRGTHDLIGSDYLSQRWIIETAQDLCEIYGYEGIATPIFESTDVFLRTLGESSDIVHKQMYTFPDNKGELLTLRPEGTAGIARAFLSHQLGRQLPLKLYYHGPMFRYERPQKGRQRQFHQFGIELLGIDSPQADIEALALGYTLLRQLGITSDLRVEINTIGDSASRQAYREKLVSYLEPFRSELSEDSQRRLSINPLRILDSKDSNDQKILASAPDFSDFLNHDSKIFFDQVLNGLQLLEIPYQLNSRLVRGLDYYSHCVFEFKSDSLGAQDTLIGGGRYDGLIELMGGSRTPGVGWAMGLERLALLTSPPPKDEEKRPLAMIPLGEKAETLLRKWAYRFRRQGLFVEMDFSGNIKKRLTRAAKAQARWALILGEEEINRGVVMLKDLDRQSQVELSLQMDTVFNYLGTHRAPSPESCPGG